MQAFIAKSEIIFGLVVACQLQFSAATCVDNDALEHPICGQLSPYSTNSHASCDGPGARQVPQQYSRTRPEVVVSSQRQAQQEGKRE